MGRSIWRKIGNRIIRKRKSFLVPLKATGNFPSFFLYFLFSLKLSHRKLSLFFFLPPGLYKRKGRIFGDFCRTKKYALFSDFTLFYFHGQPNPLLFLVYFQYLDFHDVSYADCLQRVLDVALGHL